MAIWQSTYYIVPKEGDFSLIEGISLSSFLEDNSFEDDLFWNNIIFDLQKFLKLKALWRKKPWDEYLIMDFKSFLIGKVLIVLAVIFIGTKNS